MKWLDELDRILESLDSRCFVLYIYQEGTMSERISGQVSRTDLSPLSPLMTQLRMVKECEEVEEIKKAMCHYPIGLSEVLQDGESRSVGVRGGG